MAVGHGISDKFVASLKDEKGLLAPLLKRVRADQTLCLELRENAIHLYYRGGRLLCVVENFGAYTATFDEKYFSSESKPALPNARIQTEAELRFSKILTARILLTTNIK